MSAQVSTPSTIIAAPGGGVYLLAGNIIRRINGSIPTLRPILSQGGIVNAASLQGGGITPGELISIFGSNFGQSGVQTFTLSNNAVPVALNNIAVTFNGTRGAITAAAPNQINVFVPYETAGAASVAITVIVDGAASDVTTVPLVKTAFGLSTANASGSGQGAILNQDGSVNSSDNAADAGTIVTLFGTGEGVIAPPLPDGALVLSMPYSTPTSGPVTVSIGGKPADVLYAGSAPSLPVGVLQVDVRIPAGLSPGDAPVVVSIGASSTMQHVTCAVK
jgi:uncharacterized protein (TIGR03437 family)